MIKINKELQRPDKGTVASGSIIDYNANFIGSKKVIRYNLTHWLSEEVKDEGGWMPIAGITEFKYVILKQCTDEEWDSLNDAGSAELVEVWLQEIIDSKIGAGNTVII